MTRVKAFLLLFSPNDIVSMDAPREKSQIGTAYSSDVNLQLWTRNTSPSFKTSMPITSSFMSE